VVVSKQSTGILDLIPWNFARKPPQNPRAKQGVGILVVTATLADEARHDDYYANTIRLFFFCFRPCV